MHVSARGQDGFEADTYTGAMSSVSTDVSRDLEWDRDRDGCGSYKFET